MAINLSKGGNINLAKEAPTVTRFCVGLGWDVNKFNTGSAFDLDVSAFILAMKNGAPKLVSEGHFVFYNNTKSVDGSVIHSGDERTGNKAGDDETLTIDLSKMDASASEVSIVVTIHDAVARAQNFGQVNRAYVRLMDAAKVEAAMAAGLSDDMLEAALKDATLARFDLTDDYSTETALQFASLYKDSSGNWRFKAIGAGYNMGLDAFVAEYTE